MNINGWEAMLFIGINAAISTELQEAVSRLAILLGVTMVLNSVQPVISGVAVGGGWQALVAYINLGCYYIFGLPLGYLLGYKANLGVMISEDICMFKQNYENMPLDLPFSKLFLSNLLSLIRWSCVNLQPKLIHLFGKRIRYVGTS
ncbi:protein detoxification 34 [Quercus suber]|uniref:Protein detoxification 34 n=1 Tax=Quercus suber TaxID=58331 RepID=A0AAW0IY53_QUESU